MIAYLHRKEGVPLWETLEWGPDDCPAANYTMSAYFDVGQIATNNTV